jgi:hypothetical protein
LRKGKVYFISEARGDRIVQSSRQRPDQFSEKTAIERHELRHVDHRVTRQTCLARSLQNVTRGIGQLQVAADTAAVEGIS